MGATKYPATYQTEPGTARWQIAPTSSGKVLGYTVIWKDGLDPSFQIDNSELTCCVISGRTVLCEKLLSREPADFPEAVGEGINKFRFSLVHVHGDNLGVLPLQLENIPSTSPSELVEAELGRIIAKLDSQSPEEVERRTCYLRKTTLSYVEPPPEALRQKVIALNAKKKSDTSSSKASQTFELLSPSESTSIKIFVPDDAVVYVNDHRTEPRHGLVLFSPSEEIPTDLSVGLQVTIALGNSKDVITVPYLTGKCLSLDFRDVGAPDRARRTKQFWDYQIVLMYGAFEEFKDGPKTRAGLEMATVRLKNVLQVLPSYPSRGVDEDAINCMLHFQDDLTKIATLQVSKLDGTDAGMKLWNALKAANDEDAVKFVEALSAPNAAEMQREIFSRILRNLTKSRALLEARYNFNLLQ